MPHIADARSKPRRAGNERQLLELLAAIFANPSGVRAPPAMSERRSTITDAAGCVDNSGFLTAGRAKANEFHGKSLGLIWNARSCVAGA